MMKTRLKITRKTFIIMMLCCLLIGVIAIYLFWGNSRKVTTTPSTTAQEDQEAAKKGVSQKNSSSIQSAEGEKQASSNSSSGSVASPQGNFVSNHRVSSLTTTIESICSTTYGASCNISFSKDGVIKSLGSKNVNTNGTSSWIWTPSSIGLSPGSWKITATASLNGTEASANDPLNLEITQ